MMPYICIWIDISVWPWWQTLRNIPEASGWPDVLICRGVPEETVEQTSITHPTKPESWAVSSAMPSPMGVTFPCYLCLSGSFGNRVCLDRRKSGHQSRSEIGQVVMVLYQTPGAYKPAGWQKSLAAHLVRARWPLNSVQNPCSFWTTVVSARSLWYMSASLQHRLAQKRAKAS